LDKPVISSAATVAGGRFAPGHLGELAQQVPFGMAGAVLEQTCRVQRRVRALPARVVVYRPGRILGQALTEVERLRSDAGSVTLGEPA
jgi:hypothetical protein